ncbi:MAG: flagellar filament capping protein FliD [Sarcina sp.]
MRIGGLASGLDTDTMVKQLMMPYQMKADRVKQDKILLEYKQELYRDVTKDMKGIYTKYFDIASTANKDTNLILSSNYDTVKFSSSDESVVSARGLAGAKTGNYEVTVKNMAEPSSMTLEKENIENLTAGQSVDLKLGESTINVRVTDEMLTEGKVDMKKFTSTINDKIKAHNENPGDGKKIDVKVEYSELGDNIRISGTKTGAKNTMEFGVTLGDTPAGQVPTKLIPDEQIKAAKDATVVITDAHGNSAEKTFEGNKFVIDNIEYTINGVSKNTGTVDAPKYESTKLSGIADASKIVENISAFVEDYNKLIDKMNGLMGEKRDKSFMPLTDEQKKDMSETEIKLWEEKCKKGLLRSDDIFYSTSNELLKQITSGAGSGLNLSDIGITPNADYRTQKGKITLDTEKLKTALETNGEETRKVLTDTFSKMKETFNETAISSTSKLAKRAGAADGVTAFNNELSKKIELQQKEYAKVVKNLSTRESRYYAEFARLEVAMNEANSMMGQFMSMGGM